MQFTTPITIPQSDHVIDYDSKILAFGSCFAENVAEKFDYYKFQNTVNLFGILFHPWAIHNIIHRAIAEEFFVEQDLFFANELWHCFEVHSDCSSNHKENLLKQLNQKLIVLKTQIQSASHLIITFGTAWVYRKKTTQKIVANCHKVPQTEFEKELLTATAIQQAIEETLAAIRGVNPNVHVVLTVSPVRHLKDGFIENQQSKSNIIIALHQAIRQFPAMANYFPSYEIMIDELRDYRFYAQDMLHPNAMAIEFIWEKFSQTYLSQEGQLIMKQVAVIQQGLHHRPFHPHTESHQQFLTNLQHKIMLLHEQFPRISF